MSAELLGGLAEWISAFGSIGAAIVAALALKYAKRAFETQGAQLKIQQSEVNEDMLVRKRLRQANGPLFEVNKFEHFIEGLEIVSGTVIRSAIIVNPGAWKESSDRPMKFDSEIAGGFRCLAIHNYRSTVRLGLVKIRIVDGRLENLIIARVKKIRRFHQNFDSQPAQMWAILVPENYFSGGFDRIRILFDFETEDRFFDRYEMDLNFSSKSVKQLKPIPLFDEAYVSE